MATAAKHGAKEYQRRILRNGDEKQSRAERIHEPRNDLERHGSSEANCEDTVCRHELDLQCGLTVELTGARERGATNRDEASISHDAHRSQARGRPVERNVRPRLRDRPASMPLFMPRRDH